MVKAMLLDRVFIPANEAHRFVSSCTLNLPFAVSYSHGEQADEFQ